MPNVSLRSRTKITENNAMEVDEVKVENTPMEPISPSPADPLTPPIGVDVEKPEPYSDAWYVIRKDNHKRVERRRRETINQAMDDLVAVIPGNEKNKSRILRRAVQHIKQLVEQIMALREQNEQYRETNQQQQEEIEELKARLDEQQNDHDQEEQEQQQKPASHPAEIGESS
ncbi:hypothetical protein BCR42DRAFT_421828 [Absidia repens]|uniref:BHLH domain-containing protein n=1 Tax=Absidia repens TaxID=90262 RepID=A0A1X2I860_9FUNG|nr:hypothetical protein BCR42DRAFT_421828 [Absidia repens]